MKQLVICSNQKALKNTKCLQYEPLKIKGVKFNFALVETDDLSFDEYAKENKYLVLIRILGFSSNYRDIGIIAAYNNYFKQQDNKAEVIYSAFGSEFVGVVVKKGSHVDLLEIGDRVIADNAYPVPPNERVRHGIATNRSYAEFEILDQAKLIKVPDHMPNNVAAGFSIGAQTAYSIIDRLKINNGKVLICGIKSNTSLFVLNALKKYNVNVYGTSSNLKFSKELTESGLKKLIKVPNYETVNYLNIPEIRQIVNDGGFEYIIDPFSDINMFKCLGLLAINGKYITCGIYDQLNRTPQTIDNTHFIPIIKNNLTILGSCLGTTNHLQNALDDYTNGNLKVDVAKTFTDSDNIRDFIKLSYAPKQKVLGKITFSYE